MRGETIVRDTMIDASQVQSSSMPSPWLATAEAVHPGEEVGGMPEGQPVGD